jgi:hypothetical protein
MHTADYTRLVSQIEAGNLSHAFASKEAIDRLTAEICAAPYESSEEREEAQRLVFRLYRLSLCSDGGTAKKHPRFVYRQSQCRPHA